MPLVPKKFFSVQANNQFGSLDRVCQNCRFFMPKENNLNSGNCRLEPPMAFVLNDKGEDKIKTEFPAVWNSWWCGQWTERE